MSFLRKLFSIFHFGTASPTSRQKINPATKLPKKELGAEDKSPCIFSNATRMKINPATGLPMVGGIDIAGNPYGANLS